MTNTTPLLSWTHELYRDYSIECGFDAVQLRYVAKATITTSDGGSDDFLFTSEERDQAIIKAKTLIDSTITLEDR
jgi:hypothetical protein